MPENASQESHRRRLIDVIRAEMTRVSGRRYERLNLDALDLAGLMDLQRFLRDVEAEHRAALQRGQLVPWRKPQGRVRPRSPRSATRVRPVRPP